MNAIPDKFAQWDAAYVLGALSPGGDGSSRSIWPSVLPVRRPSRSCCPPRPVGSDLTGGRCDVVAGGRQFGVRRSSELSAAEADVIDPGPPPSLLPKMIKTARTRRRRIVAAVAGLRRRLSS